MEVITFSIATLSGFLFNHFVTRPNTKIYKKFPVIKIKSLQLFPTVKLHFKHRTIWLHHWLSYSIVLIITLTYSFGFLDWTPEKGFLVGGILQGFTFPDWKKIIVKREV